MHRRLSRLSIVVAATAASVWAVHAQGPARGAGARNAASSKVPKTAWGDPDVQGVWNFGTMTPLERPAQWAGKDVLTEAEARAYERQTIERRAPNVQITAGPDWWEEDNNILKNRRTSLIVDPPDGRLPPTTPEVQARGRGGRGRGGAYDNHENLSLQDRCLTWNASGPPMLPSPYNNNVQIVQTRDHVMLMTEMIHTVRIAPFGQPHGTARSWYGDSRAHWEGTTLVVDTINFNGRLNFRNTGDRLHLVERFTPTDADTLEYRFTVDEPKTWVRPWTAMLVMTRSKGLLYEFACHEGNHIGLIGTLKGARITEAGK
jgi:hypothetical protein